MDNTCSTKVFIVHIDARQTTPTETFELKENQIMISRKDKKHIHNYFLSTIFEYHGIFGWKDFLTFLIGPRRCSCNIGWTREKFGFYFSRFLQRRKKLFESISAFSMNLFRYNGNDVSIRWGILLWLKKRKNEESWLRRTIFIRKCEIQFWEISEFFQTIDFDILFALNSRFNTRFHRFHMDSKF